MYKAIDLANYIVDKCIEDNAPITNLQLQRILYFVQKDFLKRGYQAFSDDIEAWRCGPVVPNVYFYFWNCHPFLDGFFIGNKKH